MSRVFFDTEFTSVLDPRQLSIGLVTLDGLKCSAELDMTSEFGRTRLAITPWDVRENIFDKCGEIPDAKCDSEWTLGQRVGTWLQQMAEVAPDGCIDLLYDYCVDFELLMGSLEDCNLWPQVRVVAREANIGDKTGTLGPELTAEATLCALRRGSPPLFRHQLLADAIALRASWQNWELVHQRSRDFRQLLDVVGHQNVGALYEWLASSAPAIAGRTPLDVLADDDRLPMVRLALEGGHA
jgi:hypothetical protein